LCIVTMLILYTLISLFTLVVSNSILQNISTPTFNSSSSLRFASQSPDICQNGDRKVLLDAEKKFQTLQWEIGSITAEKAPQSCQTTMSMDYSAQWQYAITAVNWKGYVGLQAGSMALMGLTYGFGTQNPGPAILWWALSGPKNDEWLQNYSVPGNLQAWSTCGQKLPLTFEWRVEILSKKKAIAMGILGSPTGAGGGNLTLSMVTEWRECPPSSVAKR